MREWLRRVSALWPGARRRRERNLNEELASHLEMAETAARGDGLSREEAGRAARRELGNLSACARNGYRRRRSIWRRISATLFALFGGSRFLRALRSLRWGWGSGRPIRFFRSWMESC